MTGAAAAAALLLLVAAAHACRRTWRVLRPRRIVGGAKSPPGSQVFQAATPDGSVLAGWLLGAPPPAALVVLCHNLGSHKGRLLPVARAFREAGHAVAAFDFRGHGESDPHRGWRTPFSRYAEDLRAVLAELRRRRPGEGRGVVLVGYSLGTVAALLVGAEDPGVRGLVFDSGPALSVTRVFRRRFRSVFGLPPAPFRWLVLPLLGGLVGESRVGPELRAALAKLGGCPLLMVHGDRDEIVTLGDAREVFDLAASAHKELWVVPGAHHMTAFALDRQEYGRRLAAFAEAAFAAKGREGAEGG